MSTKAQHTDAYQKLLPLLREIREKAGLTQRELGSRLGRPQSWVYNCESGNRRMDVTEFVDWVQGCGIDATKAFDQLLFALSVQKPTRSSRKRRS